MLFKPLLNHQSVKDPFISDDDVERIVNFVKEQAKLIMMMPLIQAKYRVRH